MSNFVRKVPKIGVLEPPSPPTLHKINKLQQGKPKSDPKIKFWVAFLMSWKKNLGWWLSVFVSSCH